MPESRIEAALDTSQGRPYKPYWNEVINVGAAADLLRPEIQEHVRILAEDFHFHYLRFWSPFSKGMNIDINDVRHPYNFSCLDQVIDFVLAQGAKPFIELAGKPERLQGTADTSLLYGVVEEANSLRNWMRVLSDFIHHVVARYGKEEVDSWKFELWFDMDKLIQQVAVFNYLQRLHATMEILHESTRAPVGAAGLHALNRRENMTESFFQLMVDQKIIPDFISVYCYAYDAEVVNGRFTGTTSTDQEYILHAVELLQQARFLELKGKPLYISEWNLTVSDRNMINDTCFKGAYIVRNYLDLFEKVDGMAYFFGTDRLSEYDDTSPDQLLFGGKGLLTRDGIRKPAAYAFDFLGRLYPRFIGKGSNYLVTGNGENQYGIICHNCKKLNDRYYDTEEDKLDVDHLKSYFEDLDPLTLCLHLQNVADGMYQMKIYRINAHHGSILQLWQEMGKRTESSRTDTAYLEEACNPNLTIQNIQADNHQTDIDITLDANEIAYIRLRPRT